MPRFSIRQRVRPTRRHTTTRPDINMAEHCRSLRSSWEHLGEAIENMRSAGDKGDFAANISTMEELRQNIEAQITRECGNINTGAMYGGKRKRRATRRGARK